MRAVTRNLSKDDADVPANNASFVLSLENGRAQVSRSQASATVRLTVAALASLFTGYATPRLLARAGALAANEADLVVLERLFAGPAPIQTARSPASRPVRVIAA